MALLQPAAEVHITAGAHRIKAAQLQRRGPAQQQGGDAITEEATAIAIGLGCAAGLIQAPMAAIHRRRPLLQRLPLQLQAQGMGEVVVVVNRQGLSRHLLNRQVAAGVLALVALLAQQPQRQIQLGGGLLQQRRQGSRLRLRRAVVHHQHLRHRHALQGHRFQGLAQQLQPRPVAGKQHRDRQSGSLRRRRQHLAPLGQAGGKHGLHTASRG